MHTTLHLKGLISENPCHYGNSVKDLLRWTHLTRKADFKVEVPLVIALMCTQVHVLFMFVLLLVFY